MLQRTKLFVSWTIQGPLLGRLAVYWLLYHFLLWHATFLIETLPVEGVPGPLAERYWGFCSQHTVWLLCMLAVAPVILWDLVKLSHRVAGPLIRLEEAVRQMAQGERVKPVTLRQRDMLFQFASAINELIDVHNRRLDAEKVPGSAWNSPSPGEPEPFAASSAGASFGL